MKLSRIFSAKRPKNIEKIHRDVPDKLYRILTDKGLTKCKDKDLRPAK